MGQQLGLGAGLWRLAWRPLLLFEAVRAAFAMRARGRLGPSRHYLAWRSHTAYGDDTTGTRPEDLAQYLTWRRRIRALT